MSGGPMQNATYNGNEYAVNRNTISIWGPGNYGAFATGTPNEVAVPVLTCDPRKNLAKNQYFNPACFSGPTNLSNGSYRLPYIHEFFNLFNHPWNEFIEYDSHMYMGFKTDGTPDSSTNNNAAAGTADNKTGHRELSLAAKFYF